MDENQLIKKAQTGDLEAFEILVIENQDFVYNLALRTLGDPVEAQDIAQDAFIRAWVSLSKFHRQAKFRTWLYRIVVNLCYNRLPRLRRELELMPPENIAELADTDRQTALETDVESREQQAFLHRKIDELPDHYRMLISLRYQKELSYEEIAALTDLPLGTVKTGLFRAKQRLRKIILEQKEMII